MGEQEVSPDPFIVLVIATSKGGTRITEALPIWHEDQAHEVAEAMVRIGHRVWLLDVEELGQHEYTGNHDPLPSTPKDTEEEPP